MRYAHPAAATYQRALFDVGIPLASFAVTDTTKEYERLHGLGVTFKTKPTEAGGTTIAVFEDSCGNFIQIYQE